MKFKSFILPLVLFLCGLIVRIIGALFKILHWELGPFNGGLLITIASLLQIIALVFAIVILLRFYFRNRE